MYHVMNVFVSALPNTPKPYKYASTQLKIIKKINISVGEWATLDFPFRCNAKRPKPTTMTHFR